MKTKTLPKSLIPLVSGRFPSFHRSGSILGMKRRFYGKDALLVRCGEWIFNVTDKPEIYHLAK